MRETSIAELKLNQALQTVQIHNVSYHSLDKERKPRAELNLCEICINGLLQINTHKSALLLQISRDL